ncbi:MAG: deoxyribonuclease V [Pseudomonadota bacterium]
MINVRQLHPWDVSYQEAVEIQKALSAELVFTRLPRRIRYVAGTDVSFSKKSKMVWAGVVVLSYPDLERVEERSATGTITFPYIPGLLSFREIPPILEAIEQLRCEPDLFFCDGQGIAHPRGLGLASHLGLLIQKPTIGCAKTRLVGDFSEVEEERGGFTTLSYKGMEVGAVVRTRSRVKPLFVSPGYRVTFEDALRMVLSCSVGFRVPEPLRLAHLLVNGLRRRKEAS